MSSPEARGVPGGPAVAGWYDDPDAPGRDRWWNGYRWTNATARTPRRSMWGHEWERMLRPGLNRRARLARIVGTVAAALVALALVLLWTARSWPPAAGAAGVVLLLALVMSLGAVVVAVAALKDVKRFGGRGSAWNSIISGSVIFVIIAAPLSLYIVSLVL